MAGPWFVRAFYLLATVFCLLLAPTGAHATDPFAQCHGGTPNTTVGDCPIMLLDASGQPVMREYTLPAPIGTVQLPEKVYFFSGPLCIVDRSVRTTMEGLYASFSDAFLYPFRVILLLYVCIYAISFIFGLVNPRDFALRLIKLMFVWVIITQNCVFYNYLYGGFISASNSLVRIMSEVHSGTPPANAAQAQRDLYTSLDNLFGNVVGVDGLVGLGIALFAFITSGAQSLLTTTLLGLGVGSMALALARALAALGIAMTATAFFLLFTPMFLAFFLFQNTKRLFDNWLSMLISFALQPFIIFAFLVMMKGTIDRAAIIPGVDADRLNINDVVRDMTGLIDTKVFNPPLMNNEVNANIYVPDRSKIIQFMNEHGSPVPAGATDWQIQEQFFKFFTPKLLFWFLINMIMASFIKEVPGFAQRLAGYISAPALGATENPIFGKQGAAMGVELPGLSRSSGGNILEAIGQKMGANATVKRAGLAGLGALGAMGMEGLRGDKARDGASAENKAKDGEVKRATGAGEAAAGQAMARAGTLKELLGDKTMEREGPKAGGIGSKKDASREGLKAVGVGEADAAMRKETVNDNMRLMEQARTNQALQRGVELANSGDMNMNINFRRKEKMDETPRDNRIVVQSLGMGSRGDESTTYLVNGREVEVSRRDEMAFVNEKLNQIEKDITKTKTMGAKGAGEAQESLRLRAMLLNRRDVLGAEKAALEAAEIARQQLIRQGQSGEQLRKLEQELPKLIQKNDVNGVAKLTAQLKASKNQKLYGQLIAEMENLQGTMKGQPAKRTDTVAGAAQVGGGAAAAPAKPAAPPPAPKRSAAQRQRDVLMRLANVRARVKEEEEKRIKELMEKNPGLTREQGKQTYDYYAKQVEERTRAIERELPTILQERNYNRLTQLSHELKISSQSAEYQSLRGEIEGLRDQLIDERATPAELARQAMEERLAQLGTIDRKREYEEEIEQRNQAIKQASEKLREDLAQEEDMEERKRLVDAYQKELAEINRQYQEDEKANAELESQRGKVYAEESGLEYKRKNEELRQQEFDRQLAENEMSDAEAKLAWEQELERRAQKQQEIDTEQNRLDADKQKLAGLNTLDNIKDLVDQARLDKENEEQYKEKLSGMLYAGPKDNDIAEQLAATDGAEEGGAPAEEQRRLKDKKSYQVSKKSMKLGPDGEEIIDELYEQHLALEELREEQEAKEEAAEKEQEVLIAEDKSRKDTEEA